MAPILLVVFPLVVVLFFLIAKINKGEHDAPQAYYRRKQGGAPLALGLEALGPRRRKRAIEDTGERESELSRRVREMG